MKPLPLIAASLATAASVSADVIVSYGTAGNTTSLAPLTSASNVTPDNLVAGAGLTVQNFSTFNFQGWDTANTTYDLAVAADDKWTWGFTITTGSIDPTTMDIRLDRSGSGPDDVEIKAIVTPNGGSPGAPISLLTHDYLDSGAAVNFNDVDISAIGTLNAGDSVEFVLGAFNSESSGGSFDLELFDGTNGIIINGNIAGVTPDLSVVLDQSVLFEDAPTGSGLHTGTVSRTGDTTNPVTVTIVSTAPGVATVDASVTILATESSATFEFDPAGDITGSQTATFNFTATGYNGTSADVTVLDDEAVTSNVVINELSYNTTGTDSEFIELFNNSGGVVDIQGWSLKVYGGDNEGFAFGAETASVDIPLGSPINIADQGFYLIGNSQFDTTYTETPDLLATLDTDNDSVTFALFDASGNLVYAASATDGDGIPNIGGSEFIDGLFTSFAPDVEFGPDGSFSPAGFRFVADGGGYFEFLEFAPQPAESATPGATNVLPAELLISISPSAVSETDGVMAAVGTVTRRYVDPASPLVVTLSDDDGDNSEISIPASVTILATDTSATFDIDALDELDADGAQIITITASAGGFVSAMDSITVTDNDVPLPVLNINEVWADDDGADDAEYVEIFGPGGASLAGLSLIVVDGDTGGSTGSANYRRVTRQIDFTTETIPVDGYFLIGQGVPDIDLAQSSNWLQNGSQTYAIVPTADIDFDLVDTDELTQASVDAITLSALDVVGLVDGSAGDHSYFGGPELTGDIDLVARNGDGVDTDSAADWNQQGNGAVENYADIDNTLGTAGATNIIIVPPVALDITGITMLNPTTVQITFSGAASTAYVLKSDPNLQGGFVTTVLPTGGSLTTDGSGDGTVEFAYSGGTLFFRIEETP